MLETTHLLLAVHIPVSYSQQNLLKKHKILIESDIYLFDVIAKLVSKSYVKIYNSFIKTELRQQVNIIR